MAFPVETHVSSAVAVRRPALEKFASPSIKLKNQVRSRVANQEFTVVLHRHLREMPWSVGRGNQVGDKLVGRRATLCLHDSYSSVGIKSGILAAVAKIDEIGRWVVQQAIRIGLELERLNQSKCLALKYPQGPVQARHVQFAELTPEKESVLGILDARDAVDCPSCVEVKDFQGSIGNRSHE